MLKFFQSKIFIYVVCGIGLLYLLGGLMTFGTLFWMALTKQDPSDKSYPWQTDQKVCAFPGFYKGSEVEFDVFSAVGHEGKPLNFQIDQSGHSAGQIDLFVDHPGKPVALLLRAYQPSIWDISISKGTELIAVAALGHYRQEVVGVSEGVNIYKESVESDGPCGRNIGFSEDSPEGLSLLSMTLFGRDVRMRFSFPQQGNNSVEPHTVVMALPGTAPASEWFKSPLVTPQSFHDPAAQLAGDAGLEAAVSAGILRAPTEGDLALLSFAMKSAKGRERQDINRMREATGVQYVITREFVFPPGLSGSAALPSFLLLPGVPVPRGDMGGTSTLFTIQPLGCTGLLCDF